MKATESPPVEADQLHAGAAEGPSLRRQWVMRLVGSPSWARPVVFMLTGVSAFLSAWRASGYLEIYYAAAVRSMSMSWHNFFFGAFDPAGTVTTDKLPGAFWVQALSVRIFGLHDWAILLPQVVEGALTVLVLFRVVRRLLGPVAGLVAAFVLVVAPANVTLDRGNVSDTLMILLVVLAADAAVTAIATAHGRWLLLAGFWVGLAFQAKMLEAWLLVPAFAAVFLVAGPQRGLFRRSAWVVAMGAVAVVVSLSWMVVVSVQPRAGRPYVDGSTNDSVFQQVFDYNGFGRLDTPSPNAILFGTIGAGHVPSSDPSWHRLLDGPFGEDTGWLLPAALAALAGSLFVTRSRPRYDRTRASALLFGSWLVVLLIVFSVSTTINSYYTAALTPAVGGLLATGAVVAWERRGSVLTWVVIAAVVLGTAIYAAWLLPAHGIGAFGWLGPVVLAVGSGAAVAVGLWSLLGWGEAALVVLLSLAAASALVVPTLGSATAVANRLGSFDTPFEPPAVAAATQLLFGPITRRVAAQQLPLLERTRARFATRDLMATQTAVVAAPTIYDSGQEVYPLGGYDGTGVAPTLTMLRSLIAHNVFRIVIARPDSDDPRYRYVSSHCLPIAGGVPVGRLRIYFCTSRPR